MHPHHISAHSEVATDLAHNRNSLTTSVRALDTVSVYRLHRKRGQANGHVFRSTFIGG